jgi:hypothetical protein
LSFGFEIPCGLKAYLGNQKQSFQRLQRHWTTRPKLLDFFVSVFEFAKTKKASSKIKF